MCSANSSGLLRKYKFIRRVLTIPCVWAKLYTISNKGVRSSFMLETNFQSNRPERVVVDFVLNRFRAAEFADVCNSGVACRALSTEAALNYIINVQPLE